MENLEKFMDRYIELANVSEEHTDLLLELLGTMVYMPTDKWEEKLEKYNMIEFLHNHLENQYAEDDILLECVMLVGTLCRNDSTALIISQSFLIKLLQDLLGSKQEDDEMVQQILNTFFKFLFLICFYCRLCRCFCSNNDRNLFHFDVLFKLLGFRHR